MRRHHRDIRTVLWILAIGLLTGQASGIELQGDFSADVGMGFDWVGQRYRLSDQDTLDQFDEKSLSATLSYGGVVKRGLWVEDDVTLSDHSLKNLLATAWSTIISKETQVMLENQLEFKDYWWRGKDLFGSGYIEDRLKLEGCWLFRPDLLLGVDQRLTYVDYKKRSSYFRDYWLSETAARMDMELGLMWNLVLDYSFTKRAVPDSSGMDYRSHSLASSLEGLVGWTLSLRLDGHLERRRSDLPEGRQDCLNLAGQGELECDLGSEISLVFRGELEQMTYDHSDEVYYDFWMAKGQLGLSRDFSETISVALLPTYGRSVAENSSIGETYQQPGMELDVNYSGTGRLWANWTLELGARDYEETEGESFYSNYTYFHPTLLLNYRLTDGINLDLFADYDPEWHKQREDNFTTSLFSCSLKYGLR